MSISPVVNWAEIGFKPTTLAGFGITDAPTAASMNSAIAAAIPVPSLATALTTTGSVTLAGAALHAAVQKVFDTATWTDVTADFESAISVAGHIQQTTGLLAADVIMVFLQP
jgi:hypothetical protein